MMSISCGFDDTVVLWLRRREVAVCVGGKVGYPELLGHLPTTRLQQPCGIGWAELVENWAHDFNTVWRMALSEEVKALNVNRYVTNCVRYSEKPSGPDD